MELFFIMAHSDFKMQARTIILTLKILIYKQAIKITTGAKICKHQHINEKMVTHTD